jgi:hypothetical protein
MAGHHRDVCPHGKVISQCRCIGPKTDRVIRPCPFPRHNGMPEQGIAGPVSSELDGATTPPAPNVQASSPGEFAAIWNTLTDEQRQGFLNAMRVADETAVRCRMLHGPQQHASIEELRGDVDFDGTPAVDDPGRC